MKNLFYSCLLMFCLFINPSGLQAQSGWQWAVTNSSAYTGIVEADPIATDPNGNVFISGNFFLSDSLTLGTHTIYGANSTFISRTDSNGNFQWVVNVQSSGTSNQVAICTDASGNSFLFGIYSADSCVIGSVVLHNPVTSSMMYFLAKLAPGGTVMWAENIIASAGSMLGGMGTDFEGNVYITGSYKLATATIGTSTLVNATPTGDSTDVFVAKYNPAGIPVWAKSFGGNGMERPWGLSVAPNGYIFITAEFSSPTMMIGSYLLTDSLFGSGAKASLITRLDTAGHPVWAKSMNKHVFLSDICSGIWNNCFVSGYYDSTIILGADTLIYSGLYGQSLVMNFDSIGHLSWSKAARARSSRGRKVAADTCGNVWLCGYEQGQLNCNGTIIDTPVLSSDNLYITAYDKCGHYIAGTGHILGSGADDLCGLALDNLGNLYTGGDYENVDLVAGPDTLLNPGSFREFLLLAKYRIGTMPCDHISCLPPLNSGTPIGNQGNIILFPNPAFNEVIIQSDIPFLQGSKAELYNITGRLINTYPLLGSNPAINVSSLVSGFYHCRIVLESNQVVMKKLLIEKK